MSYDSKKYKRADKSLIWHFNLRSQSTILIDTIHSLKTYDLLLKNTLTKGIATHKIGYEHISKFYITLILIQRRIQ